MYPCCYLILMPVINAGPQPIPWGQGRLLLLEGKAEASERWAPVDPNTFPEGLSEWLRSSEICCRKSDKSFVYHLSSLQRLKRSYSTSMDIKLNVQVSYMSLIYGSVSNLVPLVNIKIAGIWMFIPLKMVLIGIDPYPYIYILKSSWLVCPMGSLQEALPYLEEALELCRDATILTWFAWVAWTADWKLKPAGNPAQIYVELRQVPSGYVRIAIKKLPFIVSFSIKMLIFHSYVSLPEGTCKSCSACLWNICSISKSM